MVNTVFDHIGETPEHIEFTVKVSIVEIYLEKIRDLLSPEKSNLKVREDKARGIYLEDVTESYVSDENEVYDIMKLGASNRAISATNMNEGSSRSHSIFMMTIHQNNLHELSAKTGKLYLVDLAGSEKVGKTGAAGQTLEEAKNINKSLSSLGNVINALTDSKSHQHIPYRDSKLTRILQESLGGNARTTLIITCSPSPFNDQETLSTLRFGYRAKSIKNTPKINREFTVAELKLLLDKAESTLEQRERRIKVLESLLSSNGIAIPKEDQLIAIQMKAPEKTATRIKAIFISKS
jgi:kinesin family protein 5